MKILGIRKGVFEKEGKKIDYRKLYLLDEQEADGVIGGVPFNVSLPQIVMDDLENKYSLESLIGKECLINYNRWAKVESVKIL